MRYYISQAPSSPLARLVAGIFAALCLVAAFFFGLVILAIVAGAVMILSVIFWLRSFWIKRHAPPPTEHSAAPQREGEIIEAEYTVVSERRD